jgi:hypothetical protein
VDLHIEYDSNPTECNNFIHVFHVGSVEHV